MASDGEISGSTYAEQVRASFDATVQALIALDGQQQISALADLVGDPDLYNALIAGSEDLIRTRPAIFRGRIAGEGMVALWAGMVIGANVAKGNKS